MKRIWIVGSLGHMGQALIKLLDMLEYELYETDKEEVDITNEAEVSLFMYRNRPDVVINCAGFSGYDAQGKPDVDMAYKVNARRPQEPGPGCGKHPGQAHPDFHR